MKHSHRSQSEHHCYLEDLPATTSSGVWLQVHVHKLSLPTSGIWPSPGLPEIYFQQSQRATGLMSQEPNICAVLFSACKSVHKTSFSSPEREVRRISSEQATSSLPPKPAHPRPLLNSFRCCHNCPWRIWHPTKVRRVPHGRKVPRNNPEKPQHQIGTKWQLLLPL